MERDLQHYFAKHVVRSRSERELVWAEPGTGINLIRYTIVGDRYLVVTGDLGEAIYLWSGTLSFEWLAGLSLSYFASKCQASENGRGNTSWCAKACKKNILSYAEDLDADARHRVVEMLDDAGDVIDNEHAWAFWAFDFLSEFWPDMEGILDAGLVISTRCELHLLGLSMAMQQIEAAKKAAAGGAKAGA